jgi:hypothetical protein
VKINKEKNAIMIWYEEKQRTQEGEDEEKYAAMKEKTDPKKKENDARKRNKEKRRTREEK